MFLSLILVLTVFLGLPNGVEETETGRIVLKDFLLCHKPDFYDEARCGEAVTEGSKHSIQFATDLIQLDVSKMPFKMDQWIHIDVVPTPEAIDQGNQLMIKYAYLQISDSYGRAVGRIAEQIPCTAAGHPTYKNGTGKMFELFQNPGLKGGSYVMDCEADYDLSYNMNPTVPVLKFSPPVEAFYLNFKFTMEEARMIQHESDTDRISITTLLVDEKGGCYLHQLYKVGFEMLDGLPKNEEDNQSGIKVPFPCHSVGLAFRDGEGRESPLRMSHNLRIDDVQFRESPGQRPDSRKISIRSWYYRSKVLKYNKLKYNLDSLGYLPGEKEEEQGNSLSNQVRILRRPSVPLIVLPHRTLHVPTANTIEGPEPRAIASLSSQLSNDGWLLFLASLLVLGYKLT